MSETLKKLSILNLSKDEIQKRTQAVSQHEQRNQYHIEPPFGYMGALSSVSFYKDAYYIFYEWYPLGYDALSHLYCVKTTDFSTYENLGAIGKPLDLYDDYGIFAGSTIIDEDVLTVIYYGLRVHQENIVPNVLSGTFNNKQLHKSTFPLSLKGITHSLKRYHFPFLFKEDKYYLLLSGVDSDGRGQILMFQSESNDIKTFKDPIIIQLDIEMGNIEAARLHKINNVDILTFMAEIDGNVASYYIMGELDRSTGKFYHSGVYQWDYGTDFSTPYIFNNGKEDVLIAQFELPFKQSVTDEWGWNNALTIPREIFIHKEKIYQYPLEKIEHLRQEHFKAEGYITHHPRKIRDLNGKHYELILEFKNSDATEIIINLRQSYREETQIKFNYKTKILSINRQFSGVLNDDDSVYCEAALQYDLNELRIFMDTSTIEIFANHGECVMSARIFPRTSSTQVEMYTEFGECYLNMNFFQLFN